MLVGVASEEGVCVDWDGCEGCAGGAVVVGVGVVVDGGEVNALLLVGCPIVLCNVYKGF